MDIQYPISEILECIDDINSKEKRFDKYNYKTFTLNNNSTAEMKKKIIHTQGTFGETFETEEIVEDEFDNAEPFEIDEIKKIDNAEPFEIDEIKKIDNAEPFEIDEIKKIDNLEIKKEETEKNILLLTEEIPNQDLIQTIEKPNLDVEQVSKLNKQIDELKKRNDYVKG